MKNCGNYLLNYIFNDKKIFFFQKFSNRVLALIFKFLKYFLFFTSLFSLQIVQNFKFFFSPKHPWSIKNLSLRFALTFSLNFCSNFLKQTFLFFSYFCRTKFLDSVSLIFFDKKQAFFMQKNKNFLSLFKS